MEIIAKKKGNKVINIAFKLKPLHGQYPLQSQEPDVDLHDTHQWLRSTRPKAGTEGFIATAQDQSLFIRSFWANIFHNRAGRKCKFCNTSTKTIDHLISGCTILAPNGYANRNNRVAQYMHWKICNHYDVGTRNKWYKQQQLPPADTPKVTILWGFLIRTNTTIQASKSNIVLKHYNTKCVN